MRKSIKDCLRIYYNDHFDVDLGEKHRFPMEKYKLLRERLLHLSILDETQLYSSDKLDLDFLYAAHDKEYVDQVISLTLERSKARAIGLPLNKEMVDRALSSADAVFKASASALKNGFSASLCGGTHHAGYAKGEGFCFFNDFAIVCRHYKDLRILILDLDVHQGNGNSEILKNDENVFIVSFHGEKNYPFRKIPSDIDFSFSNDVTDNEYLDTLNKCLAQLKDQNFDLILYQAGVDALDKDKLGTLNLSHDCLYNRDKLVFNFAYERDIPLSMALGGGYSKPIDPTIEAYVNTYRAAKEVYHF